MSPNRGKNTSERDRAAAEGDSNRPVSLHPYRSNLNWIALLRECWDVRNLLVADSPIPPPAAGPSGPARGAARVSSPDPADADLARRVSAGDKSAFAALYDRYSRQAYSLAKRICVASTVAEDVVQEVFLAFWRNPARFDASRGGFGTWLLTLVHHKSVDAVRRETSQRRRALPEAEHLTDESIRPAPGVEEAALAGVTAGTVREALDQLTEEQRKVIALSYYGGYTQTEVAAVTGLPLGTVKSRTFAAIRKLRVALAGEMPEPSMPRKGAQS
jgi:RNA polymerase sigma factor (sigma-70 family)